jgi:hypothetical protein
MVDGFWRKSVNFLAWFHEQAVARIEFFGWEAWSKRVFHGNMSMKR